MDAGGTTTTILNAANERTVAAFLEEKIPFTAIPEMIESTLENVSGKPADSLDIVLAADAEAREHVDYLVNKGA